MSPEDRVQESVDIYDGAEAICIAAGHMGVQEHLAPCNTCVIEAYAAAIEQAEKDATARAVKIVEDESGWSWIWLNGRIMALETRRAIAAALRESPRPAPEPAKKGSR
jgi:hypothetical protein